MEFIELQILPRYNAFGTSHGLRHVNRVIKNSIKLAEVTGADINMVYVIAAYHDLGMEGPRAIHHITSGKILQSDQRLKRWFKPEQIKIMKEAVEDHRASSSRQPRSIYGKIVAEVSKLMKYSCELFNMEEKITQRKIKKNNGSDSLSTWKKNTPTMGISNSGYPTHPMKKH